MRAHSSAPSLDGRRNSGLGIRCMCSNRKHAFLAIFLLCLISWILLGFLATLTLFVVFSALFVCNYYWSWVQKVMQTFNRDMSAYKVHLKLRLRVARYYTRDWCLPDIFHQTVERASCKACLLYNDEVWTFAEVEEYSLRVTKALINQGIKKGQILGLYITSSPQYIAIWLGIARIGAIAALLNTDFKRDVLVLAIERVDCTGLIFSKEFSPVIRTIEKKLKSSFKLFELSHRRLNAKVPTQRDKGYKNLTSLLEVTPPPEWSLADGRGYSGGLLYFSTSGLTKDSEAFLISNARYVFAAASVHFWGLHFEDVVYCPLPLYHASGNIGVGQALIFGCTVALSHTISPRHYFLDCIKYKATVAQYTGDLCRYIMNAHNEENLAIEHDHSVRIMFGQCLKKQVWTRFLERFKIKKVIEFYGSTEGYGFTVCGDATPGAIGFISNLTPWVNPISVIRINYATGEPVRGSDGLCQMVDYNEPGACITMVNASAHHMTTGNYMDGIDRNALEKYMIRDVFHYGDAALESDDIMEVDQLGYLYYKDRIGAPFFWRGHNVFTTDVEAVISSFVNHQDVVVYGVEVPEKKDKAGMCAILDRKRSLSIGALAETLEVQLPSYSMPVFLRIVSKIEMTGLFVLLKTHLQEEGFNPDFIENDALFYLDVATNRYIVLDNEAYVNITSGEIKLCIEDLEKEKEETDGLLPFKYLYMEK